MSLAIDRRGALWLGTLIVLFSVGWIFWRTIPKQGWHPRPMPNVSQSPPIVRFQDVDPNALLQQILVSGQIDEGALAEIERRGPPSVSAAARFAAARYEHEHNRDDQALSHIQQAVKWDPANAGLQNWCSMLMLSSGQTSEAVAHGEAAARLQPESAEVQRNLGEAYYQAGRLTDAVTAWEHSLQISPNENLKTLLEKTTREASVEGAFTEVPRGHFVLRYEGGKPAEALSDDLFRVLERDYDDLSADLGVTLKTPVTVVFYSSKQFSDVTQSATWVGALNDGRMRIPLGDVSSITPQLNSVLRHELTHSFVHTAVPNCPVWLNEGLAQLEEPRGVESTRHNPSGEFVSLSQLEGSFQAMNSDQAQQAYFESLLAVEYLRSANGMDGLRRLLTKMAGGEKPETALYFVTGLWYDDLNRESKAYAAKQGSSDSR